jgi:hypothetical protein
MSETTDPQASEPMEDWFNAMFGTRRRTPEEIACLDAEWKAIEDEMLGPVASPEMGGTPDDVFPRTATQ